MEIVQFSDCENLFARHVRGIFDPTELHRVPIEDDIAASRVVVARLTNAADVDHYFLSPELIMVRDFTRRIKAAILGKHARDMSVSLKAKSLDEAKDSLDLSLVVNILREDVFVQRTARRAVDHQ